MQTPTPNDNVTPRLPLRRRWWLNLALLLLVAALALFAWHGTGTEKKDTRPVLTDVDANAVQRIELTQFNLPAVVLERHGHRWRLTAPIKARANTFTVDSVLQLLRAPIETPVGPAEGDLARYGLEKPSLTAKLGEATIAFGEMHPLKDLHYVRYGANVYLIASRQYAQAARSASGFIDSRLLEEGRKPVAFKLPGFALALKDGTWRREPEDKELSSDRVNAFVQEWRHARALKVGPASSQPVKERVVITFEDDGGKRSTLSVGVTARAPELVLVRADEGLEYRFPEETGQRLLTLVAENPK